MEYGPILSTRVAVLHGSNVLLLKRHPDSNNLAGYWEFTGGGIQPGEFPVAAGHREVLEETGQDVDMLTFSPYVLKDRLISSGKHSGRYIRTFGLVGLIASDEIILSPEHSDFRWANPAEVTEMAGITPDTKRVVRGLSGVLGIAI